MLSGEGSSFAQNIDSLQLVLKNARHDTTRVDALYAIGEEIYLQNQDSALALWIKAQTIAENNLDRKPSNEVVKKAFRNRLAATLNAIGYIYDVQGDLAKGLEYYNSSLKLYEEDGNKEGIATCFNNIGFAYKSQGDIPKALEYLEKSLKIVEQFGDKDGIAIGLNNIGLIYEDQGDIAKALEFHERSLKLREEIGKKSGIARSLSNIGVIYINKGDIPKGLEYHQKSLKIREEIADKQGIAHCLKNIGHVYRDQGNTSEALKHYEKSLKIFEEFGDKQGVANLLQIIGDVYFIRKDYPKAEDYLKRSIRMSRELGFPENIRNVSQKLARLYTASGKYQLALENYQLYIQMRDSLDNIETQKATIKQQTKYTYEKRELAVQAEQEKKDAIALEELEKQKLMRNGFVGGFAVMLLFAAVFFTQRNNISKEKKISDKERKRSEELLLNILPEEVAEELKAKGEADAKHMDDVTVLFTDFKGFTAMSELVTPKQLVKDLHECFSAFDNICDKYGIEKIKTIGDAYMAAGGVPTPDEHHAENVLKAALEMRDFVEQGKARKIANNLPYFEIRVGIHSGPIVAGIVGVKKFAYDIWGDTVNTASRMESSGEVGKVNVSGTTYELVKDQFACTYRGKISAKGKGEIDMYFVEHSESA